MTRKILLENVQVGIHGDLKAKLVDRDGVEAKEFLIMHEEMNVHFDNDQIMSVIPYHPHEGQVCVGKVGTVWHRVRVDGKLSMKNGLYASCFLIDEGIRQQIPVPCLRQIPPRFAKLPHQIKQLALDGIKPLSLQISPDDLMVYERSVIKWDSSAVKFISDHVKAAVTVKVKVVSRSADGVFNVIMYLYTRSGNRVCLNDALVDQRYAVSLDHDDTPTIPVQNHRKKPEGLGSLRMMKIPADDDIHNYQAKSDVEQLNTRDKQFDRGCITDTEAVSALSHRLLPRLVNQSKQQTGDHVTRSNDQVHNLTQSHDLHREGFNIRNQEQIKNTDILSSSCSSISPRGYLSSSAKNLHKDEPQYTSSHHLDSSSSHQNHSPSYLSQNESIKDSDSQISEKLCTDHLFEPRGVKHNMIYTSRYNEDTASNKTSPLPTVGRGLNTSISPKLSVGRGSASLGRGALQILPSSNESLKSNNTLSPAENLHHNKDFTKKELTLNEQSTHDILDLNRDTNKLGDTSKSYTYQSEIVAKKSISDTPGSISRLDSTSSVDDKQRPRFPPSYESGSESSVSCMSAVAASVTGQFQAFTKSRRPQQTPEYSSDSRGLNMVSENANNNHSPRRQTDRYKREMTTKTDPVKCLPSYQSSSDTDSPTSTLQNKVMEARKRASAESRRETQPNNNREESVLATSGNGSLTDRKTEMLGKFSGEKLMRELASSMSGCSQGVQGIESSAGKQKADVPGMFGRVDNVLVHGKALKKPIYNIEGFPFINEVLKHWETNKFVSPKLIQSYGWPAVMSGRHITAISPQGSGKTMTYLYSLMTYLSGSNMYRELPFGMGPLVIILSKSWRKAELVYHTAQQIRQGSKSRILLVYGGGLEGNRALELVDGCDILITTPPSLKRLLEKGYTDLRRLCHLVIDDCDQVLNTFHVEINYIKSEYSLVMQNEIRQLECPRQILVFGSQWNEINSQFTENVLSEPILVITSPFEAAIYGKVRQIPHFCKKDRRMSEVIGLLQNIVDTEHRIVIFSSSRDDIRFIVEGLRAYAYNLIVVTEQMELYDVKAVADDWARGAHLLVCSDNHVMDMNIVNATVVIHYDLPDSKTKFGNRMSCMQQHFYNFTTAKHRKRKIDPASHLLITETCGKQVRTIQELLKRSSAEIPKELKAFLAGMVEKREQDDNKELCYQLLAYGTCRDNWKCGCRHIVIPEIDTSPETEWLPNEGQVKVLVTHVNDSDASHFYVRLLSITHEDGTISQPTLTYAQLVIDLECWYKKLENQTRNTAPYTGELCGYQDRGVFYRVQILDIPNMNTHGKGTGSIEVSVKFVDIGKDMDIDLNKLYVLPIHLKKVPFQAVEVFVCRVKPVDKDPEWTVRASMYVNELLFGKELEGKIVLRLGGILWLDPLVERVWLGQTGTIINRSYVHDELIRNGFANENPTHLEKLYKLCEGKIKLPRALLVKTKMSQILQTDSLPLCRQYHDVHISSVTSPDKFFIQRREKNAELEELMDEIAQYVHDLEADDGQKRLEVGQYCLAQYESFDERWYRARVMDVFENTYKIYFADYGDMDTVPTEKVKEFPADKFFDLPLQAIECRLAGVCTDKGQEKHSGDALWDLTHFVNGDLKSLVVTVKSQTVAEFAGRYRFVVDMFDTNGSEDMNIAQELVYRHLVLKSQENSFDDLFPKPSGSRRKIYSSPLQKVPDMVALIYWEADSNKSSELANQLLNLFKSSVSRSLESVQPGLISSLQCLTQLVSRINKANIEAVIQECILELLNTGDKICEEFLHTNCLASVVRCLEMESNSSMQSQAAEFIAGLCTVSTKIRSDIQNQRSNILYTLNELFECTSDDLTQASICKAFTALCSGSDSVFQYLMEKSVCSKLKQILVATDKHEVQESVILLLSALSDHDESHNDLKRESLIEAIVSSLKSTCCNKCIQHSVEFCSHYASTRRKHKTHLLEVQMVPVLNRIIMLDIQSTTKQLCKDLLSSLVVKFPSEPMAGVSHPMERNNQITDREVPPNVHWCQTTFIVQLSLKIREATCSKNSFIFTEQTVAFRETVKGTKYAFHLELFGKITPAKCRVAVKAQEVLVSLHKQMKGRWTRLLRGRKKPTWIFVDHDRYVDSSSDSDTYDERKPFVYNKKKKTKKLPTDKAPNSARPAMSDPETETDDSLDYFEDPYEKDEFDILA